MLTGTVSIYDISYVAQNSEMKTTAKIKDNELLNQDILVGFGF